ncbi:putative late blight resistance protein homolog R1B-16 [Coffea arabica]|uniref:Late blight resistance protein homolog R1B-8 n=1 Tax=Coffea arabica TaxID=13443 RepID=A0A6P6TKU8_COFAR|nr:putative late blight resistance protein homolog R1B-8 [Coffea arabica]XP_027079149.1 putative late blight resistance protein homolog R1B-8 [Coffea arabica]XP_027079150.1 putative late blight resistance protein homolog R1B-8 [Coffea arabica]XP_027079151.1 putative late blight resistance protein homolog R1B-8 [Coffea arabica]
MMNISSSSSTSCFDSALDYLGRLEGNFTKKVNWQFDSDIRQLCSHSRKLKVGIRLLKTFHLYVTKCRRRSNQGTCLGYDKENRGDAKSDRLRPSSISFRIQDLVMGILLGLDSAFFRFKQGASDLSHINCELAKIEENMRCFSETDIEEFNITSWLLYYSLGDSQLAMDFIDSISENLRHLCRVEDEVDEAQRIVLKILEKKLMFLKSFIGFATLQGCEVQQSKDLLVHVEVAAVNAASLMCRYWFQINNEQVHNEMKPEIFELIHKKIDPIDPQVREMYINVLAASKLSRSSYTFTMKENKHLVTEFIDHLLQSLMELLESYTSFLVPVKDQMLKLHQGLRFLVIFLSGQQEKFDELNDEMKDLIGFVVSDAGIVIVSLSVNEMKEGLHKETDLALSHLLEVLKLIIAEVGHIYSAPSSSSLTFPRTNELGSLDSLLETLKELASSTAASIAFPNDQIRTILEDLVFLRSFLGNVVEQRKRNEKLQALWSRVMKVAYSVELEVDFALAGDQHEHCLDAIARDIKLVKIEAEEIYDSIRYDVETQRLTKITIHMPAQVTAPTFNEALVGLDDEVESIIDRLTRGSSQLDVVAIVGMPGLGKTTLANNVYGDTSIKFHFQILAWCTVSQVYSKHNLLLQILSVIDSNSSDQCHEMNEDDQWHEMNKDDLAQMLYQRDDQWHEMNEDDLAQTLYQRLKRKRYVIVLDDVWDIEGWNLLKHSFPDDCNGSRILLTSRFQNLSLQIKPDSQPHHLRPLTDKESFELLQKKLFAKEDYCPPALREVVQHVAKDCKGLPLTIVLVAGILATTEQDCWEEVARRLRSSIFADDEHCMKTIEHSYNYLPDYLKPCLLYFGASQEDKDIPVRKLLWLWMAEGFVQKTEGKSLEDVADDYLMDLIGRSLVMATKQRSLGGIKVCRVHDLVREFCVAKAREESFLQISHGDDHLTFIGQCNPHRLAIYPTTSQGLKKSMLFFPNLRSLLFFDVYEEAELGEIWFKLLSSKLIRVLDLGYNLAFFSEEVVVFFVHLRYLNIRLDSKAGIPSAIAKLSRLETFVIIKPRGGCILLPNTIWNIKTLRHLVVSSNGSGFEFPIDNLEGSPDLIHLDTLTLAIDSSPQSLQKTLTKIPSIRRLKCVDVHDGVHDGILVLEHLSRLESLKMSSFKGYEFEFPLNLRKLTLSNNRQPWSKISAIGKLPNLEVLKLGCDSFVGEKWEMKEGEFQNLRFLELSELDFRWWTASSDNFCCLEKLVLSSCESLEEVPSCLGEALTLDMIDLEGCRASVVTSVKQIQHQQMDMGNNDLKLMIDRRSDRLKLARLRSKIRIEFSAYIGALRFIERASDF